MVISLFFKISAQDKENIGEYNDYASTKLRLYRFDLNWKKVLREN